VTLINKAATKEAALSCLFSPVILFLNSLHLPRGYFMGYAKLLFIYAYCVYHLWHLHSAGVGQSVGIWGESGESGKLGNRGIWESGEPEKLSQLARFYCSNQVAICSCKNLRKFMRKWIVHLMLAYLQKRGVGRLKNWLKPKQQVMRYSSLVLH